MQIYTYRYINTQTDRQTDRQADRQADRQTDRQTDIWVGCQGIIQKKYGCIGSWQSRKRRKLGVWGSFKFTQGVQGNALVNACMQIQFCFFSYKHAKMVIVRVIIV